MLSAIQNRLNDLINEPICSILCMVFRAFCLSLLPSSLSCPLKIHGNLLRGLDSMV